MPSSRTITRIASISKPAVVRRSAIWLCDTEAIARNTSCAAGG